MRRPALADQTEVTGPDLRLVVPAGAAWLGSLWGLTHDASAAVTSLSLLLVGTAAFAVLGGARARARLRSASAVRLVALSACIGAAGTVLAAGLRIGALEDGPVVRLAHQGAAGEVELVVTSDPRPVRSRVVGQHARADRVRRPGRPGVAADRRRGGASAAAGPGDRCGLGVVRAAARSATAGRGATGARRPLRR